MLPILNNVVSPDSHSGNSEDGYPAAEFNISSVLKRCIVGLNSEFSLFF